MSNEVPNEYRPPINRYAAPDEEVIDDLMIRPHEDARGESETTGSKVFESVRDIAARLPESLSNLGRNLSREIKETVESARNARDEYIVAVKLSEDAQEKIEQLVQSGAFSTRAEAAAFLIDEGIKVKGDLFNRVEQKLHEIERLRAELRGMVGAHENTAPSAQQS